MNEAAQLINIAAGLISEDNDNHEYDRAAAEIVTEYLGLPMDAKEHVLEAIRVRRDWSR